MTIFDGYAFAATREIALQQDVEHLQKQGTSLVISAILFLEDSGSRLYTRLKQEAAQRVGIEYRVIEHRLSDPVASIQATVERLNADTTVTGIIIQKPRRSTWVAATADNFQNSNSEREAYSSWWHSLTKRIAVKKDVDGLHPQTLQAIEQNTWKQQGLVLPATCQAVLDILSEAQVLPAQSTKPNVLVLGKSDILGLPLSAELHNLGCTVTNVGSAGYQKLLHAMEQLKSFDVIVSATGVHRLLNQPTAVKPGVVLVDVGEPLPDIEIDAFSQVARFITPVPGGVGPVTVVSLLENVVNLSILDHAYSV